MFIRRIFRKSMHRITKLDTEMFHHEYLKSIYFGVKKSNVKVTRHEKQCQLGFCNLVSAASSSSVIGVINDNNNNMF